MYGTAEFAHWRLDTKKPKPAAIISGPKRLSGRRHHAIRPAAMYGTPTQTTRAARSPGSVT